MNACRRSAVKDAVPATQTALTRYSFQVGQLIELNAGRAALVAAKQEAERETAQVKQAKIEVEIAHDILRQEMACRQEPQCRLAYIASHDALTGLPNRTLINEILNQATTEQREHGRSFALMYIDSGNFKDVNDTRGHALATHCCAGVAVRLRNMLRAGETLARLGGDEFAVLQTEVHDATQACALGDRLVVMLNGPFVIEDAYVRFKDS